MTDIVTGGCGFIGSHLVDALLPKNEVHVIDNNYQQVQNEWQLVPVNLSHHYTPKSPFNLNVDRSDISKWHFPGYIAPGISGERFFHLAALADIVPSIENPVDYFHTNVTGTLNTLESARKSGCKKFIYAASASCYGIATKWVRNDGTIDNRCREYASCNPIYPYALTKYLGEQLVMHWSKVYGIPAISLRFFNVYGPRSRTNGAYGAMFGTFLAQLANGKPVTIVGDGTQSRDFVYVSDVVDAMLMAADSDCVGIYNVGTGKPISVNRIVELLGAKEIVNIPKRPGEPDITCADISKIKSNLGWEPKVSIEEGVTKLLEHIDSYRDAPVWVPETIEKATKTWFERLG